ncbi:MAG: HAD-IIIA family hydrolase [Candidatus Marinimicrobia bacterium]|jgi:putative hydrolase of the HAD superfamily|nr:HAD-IIIA family hydrolase [Candidatus Neomarinimicrobiota bacterium]MBT3518687.1 HAD-IIIA family hydrolase [Candidatus Neomarinimicrobiota bacterium]MBT3945488.1 HAD-IIIA family hydrolase [Candidatus Neomarinimicrobiota bacterium]MBT4155425.1 HAD-IIIA family hydrolase [Candidatus Neomarinimicrobiota bacterium]MBT4753021.1 HAD-IIIA family hydrolase [Candidatus Neomarinimicrobiota bacterium]|tara:strand:- start:543 stop:1241 length:699 start_codon:yes stop_codon:yes gene_type:complete
MSQQKIKGVIFDLDNTLLDFMKMKELAVKAAIRSMIEAGLLVDEELSYNEIISIYEQFGWENQKVFDVFIEKQIGRVDNKFLAAGIVAYRRAREANLMAYPNVNKTLMSLAKMGIKLGVVSDAPSREAWMRIYYLNLYHYFDVVITHDDSGERKPSAKPFQMALDAMKLNPNETIMIGDWPERDVVGAKQIGMKTVFARYGDTFGTINSGADWEINDIYQLVVIINEFNNVA